jgi:hypothetical protein
VDHEHGEADGEGSQHLKVFPQIHRGGSEISS